MAEAHREALLREYGEVASNSRLLDSIRFELAALLPIAASAATASWRLGTRAMERWRCVRWFYVAQPGHPGNPRKMRGVADHPHVAPGLPGRSILSSPEGDELAAQRPTVHQDVPTKEREMATNINLGDASILVQEDPTVVANTLKRNTGPYAKFTMLNPEDKQPVGDVWVNPDHVRFMNEMP